MPWTLIYSPNAVRQLRGLNEGVRVRIVRKLETLTDDPYLHVRRLRDSPLYSLRSGEYRVILSILPKKILICVVKVGHRRNIYHEI